MKVLPGSGMAQQPGWGTPSPGMQPAARPISWYGASVATAGDVNGDGYDDIMVGAPYFGNETDTPPENQGKIFVYYGDGGAGVSLQPRQSSFGRPIAHLGRTTKDSNWFNHLYVRLLSKCPFWKGRIGMYLETQPLDGILGEGNVHGISNVERDYGAPISTGETLRAGKVYHWRARLTFEPYNQPYLPATRWLSMPYHGWNEADLRIPEATLYLPIIRK